ncbi:MAG TPA: 4'-phosphopantetheinyl transferase superfamily protein [Oligoflexus sp.]|uniref:4'-phosphopantetheinyl transferase superfamily protein n=1 Tax=Oligoflexus sp. TaxID=1971216 RepID=UPI002D7E70A9|nr:4'-phosphopantetheinyl transferase superfamily protein [Oligoflexus sp.]HET9238549.1 4'-phosphopantetheinyl transferase superfamily protein [Oligoflexus sp.]
MRLGNDIVDRKATAGHNPRFTDRILNPLEKSRRQSWSLDESFIWFYWAAKEAAYKAIRQSRDIPFHHREFIVSDDMTRIVWKDEAFQLQLIEDADAIFALATDGQTCQCRSQRAAFPEEPTPALQSEKARALLLDLAATHLSLPRSELSFQAENRIPKLIHQGKPLPHAMSLTHHGRYVAASLAIP